jgi:hypothetical protein
MPHRMQWTEAQDRTLRRLRHDGLGWDEIAAALRLGRNAVMERARRIHAVMARDRLVTVRLAPDEGDRPALPPGHELSWGLLVAGTLLDGSVYTPPGAMGRRHAGVVGDS